MKKFLFVSFIGVAFLFSANAYCAEGYYVSGNIGLAMPADSELSDSGVSLDMEFDEGVALGIAGGYDFGSTRLEGEIAYQKNDFDQASYLGAEAGLSGDATSLALMVNGYYDFHNTSKFTPFVLVGVGMANLEVNDLNVSGSGLPGYDGDDTVFAYQVGAGVGYAVSERVTVDVTYRYFATEDPEFDSAEAEFASHNVLFGARVSF